MLKKALCLLFCCLFVTIGMNSRVYATEDIRDNSLNFDTSRLEEEKELKNQNRSDRMKDLFSQKDREMIQEKEKNQNKARELEKDKLFTQDEQLKVSVSDISGLFQQKTQANHLLSVEQTSQKNDGFLGIVYLVIVFIVLGMVMYISYRMNVY